MYQEDKKSPPFVDAPHSDVLYVAPGIDLPTDYRFQVSQNGYFRRFWRFPPQIPAPFNENTHFLDDQLSVFFLI